MTVQRFYPTTEETKARMELHGVDALTATRELFHDKLIAEVQDIRSRSQSNLPVEGQIADVLEMLIVTLVRRS